MIHAQRFTAVLVEFAKSRKTQLNVSASLNALKRMTREEKSARTVTRHGEAIAKFIDNVVFATPKTIDAATLRTLTSISITTENANSYR